MRLNVTPEEFIGIRNKIWANDDSNPFCEDGRYGTSFLIHVWGLDPFTPYNIVVRKDVTHIPYYGLWIKVPRVEKD